MDDLIIEKIVFSQAPDTCSDKDELQKITIEFLCNGLNYFWKIVEAENWAVSPENAIKLVKKLNEIADTNTKHLDNWYK